MNAKDGRNTFGLVHICTRGQKSTGPAQAIRNATFMRFDRVYWRSYQGLISRGPGPGQAIKRIVFKALKLSSCRAQPGCPGSAF